MPEQITKTIAKEGANPMRAVRLGKLVLNVGCGTSHSPETAKYMLEKITGTKAVITHAKVRTTWGTGKGKPIGAKVTVRGAYAAELLKRLLAAADSRIKKESFDDSGNVAFGIPEYIEIPGATYDPKIGLMGLDVCIQLERRGYRVRRKKLCHKLGKGHRINAEEAMDFIRREFGVSIFEKEVVF